MNNVSISGNLCADPELRATQGGKQVASFTVAINEGKDKTEFINCVAWDKTAELISQYCKKGDRMACTGRLQTRSYETQDGQKKYITEVVVNSFDFPPKRDVSHETSQSGTGTRPSAKPADEFEDEIPFRPMENIA